jgi:MIP family channel proteins/HAD superfamily hydrolase (TIGR01549 family)
MTDTATEQVVTEQTVVEQAPGEPTTRSAIIGEILGCTILGFLGLSASLAGFYNREGVVWTTDIWTTIFAWAFSIALAIYITAALSGAHFNPAITIALATSRRFPWRRVPMYIACDLLGWFIGTALAWLMVGESMRRAAAAAGVRFGDPGSEKFASALTTYVPAPGFGTGGAAYAEFSITRGFVGEILGTMILVLVVLALSESRHATAPAGWFFPLIVGTTVGLIILIEAPLSQASLNPARDLGPRVFLLLLGFGSVAFPGPRSGMALLVTTIGPVIGALLGMLIHDKLVRNTLATLTRAPLPPKIHNPGDLVREPVIISQLPADIASLPARPGSGNGARGPIELVVLDVGGCLYNDDAFAQALLRATRELAGDRFDERAYWQAYHQSRADQSDLRTVMAERFGVDRAQLHERARPYLRYTADQLYPDVKDTLRELASRYKLAIVANQDERVLEALRRDGLVDFFDVLGLAKAAGVMKPDPRIWQYTLHQAGVDPRRAVHVGNRLDSDVRAAKGLGMRTIWLLRGEAPPSPTIEQLDEPDAVVTNLASVPDVVAGMTARAGAATSAGA